MDKTSKSILNYMKENPDTYLMYCDDPYNIFDISEDEFFRCVQYLAGKGLIQFIANQDDTHIGVALTHTSVHSSEIKRDAFFSWLFHTFIGGVITGVVSTLLSEGAIYLCVKLVQLLLQS